MKTREEVEALKRNWLGDGCWDIYETEGFEEYREELRIFQINTNEKYKAKQYLILMNQAKALGIDKLGDTNDEPDFRLAQYLMRLEERLVKLETHHHQCHDSQWGSSEPIYKKED